MSPTLTIVLIIVVLVVIAAIVYGVQAGRRKKLQSTFGPEYDRAVADTGSRTEAEKELREREKRHAELELKPLSPESQAKYSADWEEVQLKFVDDPAEAVGTADDLVTRLITERGYPTRDYEDRLADLSVEHARTLGHYRDAHEISERNRSGSASTEDLRQALVHYRALFADLLGTDPVPSTSESVDSAPAAGVGSGESVRVDDSASVSASDRDVASAAADGRDAASVPAADHDAASAPADGRDAASVPAADHDAASVPAGGRDAAEAGRSDSSDLPVSGADTDAERPVAATTEDTRETPAPAPRKAADDTTTTASDTSR
jgi:hypothetical protein